MTGERGGAEQVEADVVIVGYGPVGATAAILLAQLGRRVVLLERWPAPYPQPRAVHFDHEVGRILQACGIGSTLSAISEPGEVYEWRSATGATLLRFGRVGAGASGWPESSMFNQPALEAALVGRVDALEGIEVLRGVEATTLDQDADGVTVGAFGADGRALEARGRFVVGCDGANSTVRRLAGLDVVDLGFFYDWLIVDVVLDEPRVYDPINLQICDPARPTTVVSGGPGRRRWEFMRLPHEQLDELNDERVAWQLLEPWEITPSNATLERHAVYTFNARYAAEWRDRRVLLAGDAAHQMPPFAGQGMCAGVRDAANLTWKLDLVLDGRVGDDLLDTYADERMPHARGVIDFSMSLGRVICVADPDEADARDAAMAAAVTGALSEVPPVPPIEHGCIRPDDALAGHLFPQGEVAHGGERARFDDVFGVGWRLVTDGSRPVLLDEPVASWFAGIGGRVVELRPGGDAEDVDGTYARWFARHEVCAALQRPDFQVFGATPTGSDPAAVVRDLHGQLAHPARTS